MNILRYFFSLSFLLFLSLLFSPILFQFSQSPTSPLHSPSDNILRKNAIIFKSHFLFQNNYHHHHHHHQCRLSVAKQDHASILNVALNPNPLLEPIFASIAMVLCMDFVGLHTTMKKALAQNEFAPLAKTHGVLLYLLHLLSIFLPLLQMILFNRYNLYQRY